VAPEEQDAEECDARAEAAVAYRAPEALLVQGDDGKDAGEDEKGRKGTALSGQKPFYKDYQIIETGFWGRINDS